MNGLDSITYNNNNNNSSFLTFKHIAEKREIFSASYNSISQKYIDIQDFESKQTTIGVSPIF